MPILNNLKIIIPMASDDKTFKSEFKNIKPLVKIGNSSMINLFISNFKINAEYIFLCRQQDLIETDLLTELNKLKIKKKIVSILKNTSSAIETILFSEKYLNQNDHILIAHPDGLNFLNFKKFLSWLKKPNCDGFLCAFDEDSQTNTSETHTGRVLVKKGSPVRIAEKSIKTEKSLRLAGIYFFSNFKDFKHYAKKTILNQPPVRGRHFISQIYNEYIKNKKRIKIFKFEKHVALGLESYVKEYNFWHTYFYRTCSTRSNLKFNFVNVIPSCGDGERFFKKDKKSFKPLINVNKDFMISTTIKALPKTKKNVVIIRKDHDKKYSFKKKILENNKNTEVIVLEKKTSGMANTCYQYLKNIKNNPPLLLSSCDYDVIYDAKKLKETIQYFNPDVLVWTFKKYPDVRISPFSYAYCDIRDGKIFKISEKVPISDNPHKDSVVQGIFYFKSKKIFMDAYGEMVNKKNMINNEYYVGNSINYLIQKNYNVLPFQVDQYICLGTPEDLKIYNYWKNYFYD